MSEWKFTNLGELLEFIGNGTSDFQVSNITEFPVTRIETISDGTVDFSRVGYLKQCASRYLLKKGDILFSNINSVKHIGKVALYSSDEPLYHGMNLLLLRANQRIDSLYLFYNLIYHKSWFEKMAAQAINQASINQTTLENFKFKIAADKKEQRRISSVLRGMDVVIDKTQAAIEKYKAIKKGMLHDLFTRGIDTGTGKLRPRHKDAPELYKETKLGWVPKEWEVESIGNVSSLVTNGFVGIATPFYTTSDKGVPYLFGTNVREDYLDYDDIRYISRDFHASHLKSQLKAGDMLCVQSGHIGTCAVVPDIFEEANCHALIITRFYKDQIYPSFISFYLNSAVGKSHLDSIIIGSTIKHINTSDLAKHLILKPPLNEQKVVSGKLTVIDQQIKAEDKYLHKLQQMKQGLMGDLLSGKKRVGVEEEVETGN